MGVLEFRRAVDEAVPSGWEGVARERIMGVYSGCSSKADTMDCPIVPVPPGIAMSLGDMFGVVGKEVEEVTEGEVWRVDITMDTSWMDTRGCVTTRVGFSANQKVNLTRI